MKILIKNGYLVDPGNNIDGVNDILIEGTKISRVAKKINNGADNIIDASGKIVIPGLVDMHVHLREPGREDKETVASGSKAALAGGVSSVLAMPNTSPAMDCAENINLLKSIIKKSAGINIFIAGAITKGRNGKELSDIAQLKREGAIAITDDGSSVDSDELMLEGLLKAKQERILTICHSEDKLLSAGGMVNLGFISTRMGLKGISKESEYARVKRDVELAKKANAPIHIAHLSCKESVEIIAKAKQQGLQITCETAPHYFALSQEAMLGYDTNLKMNPPLRSQDDLAAIRQGLEEGIIDVIASDHAPHTENEKEIEFERAEFGVIGLETELAVTTTELLHTGLITWQDLVKKMALNPAKILGLNKGSLGEGSDADLAIISPDKEWIVEKAGLFSKSKNCAFLGKKLKGRVEVTICAGKIAYKV